MTIHQLTGWEHAQAMRLRAVIRREMKTGECLTLAQLIVHMNTLLTEVDKNKDVLWNQYSLRHFIGLLGWSKRLSATRLIAESQSAVAGKINNKRELHRGLADRHKLTIKDAADMGIVTANIEDRE